MEDKADADGCSYRRISRKTCNTVEDPDTKRPILRCHKLEKLIRECPGRRPVVVESKSEETEEEIPDEKEDRGHQHLFGSERGGESSSNPLSRFAEAIEEHLSGEIEGLVRAAEDIANELFGSFKIFRHGDEEGFERHGTAPSPPPPPPPRGKGSMDKEEEVDFADFRKGFKEV